MRIRTQFALLICAVVLIPFVCIVSLPVYHYLTSPQRYLLKDFKEVKKMADFDASEEDWESLRKNIMNLPPRVQIIVCHAEALGLKVIISNMEELKAGTLITPINLWNLIHATSDSYDYQLQAPTSPRKLREAKNNSAFIFLSRTRIMRTKPGKFNRFYIPAFIILIVFELFCITLIIRISRTISKSIMLLEKSTQKIADGELDTKLPEVSRSKHNEITSLTESLEKMRISLKDDLERRTKFIMGISHDLRTPVALIKGYTEAISDGVVNDMDSVKKSLAVIAAKTNQLETMINDLINYVKLNSSDWRQTLEPVLVKPLLKDFASAMLSTGDIFKRDIHTSVEVEENTKLSMDKNLFGRALENLLSNALRYTKDGDSIDLCAYEDAKNVTVSIRDSGQGIAQNDLEHIYDLFYRGTASRREQGMGIGLSVVKTIVDSHGWSIQVSSELGKGSEFIITMPKENP